MREVDGTPSGTTDDAFFDGALRLWQLREGHRAGTDAVLLAGLVPPESQSIADLGAGCGIVGLRAAQLNPTAAVTLVEREPELSALAKANAERNGLADRVRVEATGLKAFAARPAVRERFDAILTNPPFFRPEAGRTSRDVLKARAHVFDGEAEDGLDGWIRAAVTLLAPGGTFALVHRADAVGEVLAVLARRFGGVELRFVHARPETPAIRVLARGIKGSRAALCVGPPVILTTGGKDRVPQRQIRT